MTARPFTAALALLLLVLAGCDSAPVTDRRQLIVIPESQERAMGAQAARDILRTEKLSRNAAMVDAVKRVGERIARVSGEKNMAWEFHVIDNDSVPNAFCLPGGKIFVYSGLFKYVRDEDQLATVVAHEVAHAMARHGAERATVEMAARLGGAILNFVLSEEDPMVADIASKIWGYGSNLGVTLPYSRKQEYEADKIGLHLMDKAGYDMEAALAFWDNMRKNPSSPKVFAFLSTHPTDEKRIERIKKDIKEIRDRRKDV
ncbi:MAG: M48 family metallopeptidase [Thermodesulfobacteriota bacterium]